MSTKFEAIEMLRERANVTYEQAREAFERCNENVVEALIYLERNNKIKAAPEMKNENGYSFIRWIKAVIRKGNRTKLALVKNGKATLKIALTLLVIIAVLAPHFTAIAFLIALFTEHRFQIIKENGEAVGVRKAFNDTVSSVNNSGSPDHDQDYYNKQ